MMRRWMWLATLVVTAQLALPARGQYLEDGPSLEAPRSASKDAKGLPPVEKRRVLIISVDGLRPDVMLRSYAPHIRGLMKAGTYDCWARTTAVAVTLPSHTSMLTGVTPNMHGIEWNSDEIFKLREPIYPGVATIFEEAHIAGRTTGMVAGKSKFSFLNKPGSIDNVFIPNNSSITDDEVARRAIEIIRYKEPQVMFVHLPDVDKVGHSKGWGSKEQEVAVEMADRAVGMVLDAMDEEAKASTLVILSADHGGAGRGHGADDPRSRHIPWIVAGPGVLKDFDLTQLGDVHVRTEDTFATAEDYLGLPLRAGRFGKPVRAIYGLK